ncbi:MAG: molybdate ABC transporter substrate-binding protein [Pseudomonadota bacterium]
MIRALLLLSALLLSAAGAWADKATVAVASNFKPAMDALKERFEAETDHKLTVIYGSTGKLYSQISLGAPYDVYLAADQKRPARLAENGSAVKGTRFTYASGQLVLWAPHLDIAGPETVEAGQFRFLAIANPELAPYGLAAQQVLARLGLETDLTSKLAMGENIGQAFAFVKTGNADLGLIAQSQLLLLDKAAQRNVWHPPTDFYDPIRQDGVLLTRAVDNPAAQAFLTFLKSDTGQDIITRHGYGRGAS